MFSMFSKKWLFLLFLTFLCQKLYALEDFGINELSEINIDAEVLPCCEKENDKTSIAACFFAQEDYRKVIEALSSGNLNDNEWELLALAYQENGDFQKAAEIFEKLPKNNFTQLQLGLIYYSLKDWERALKSFQNVSWQKEEQRPYLLSQMYQIRVETDRENFKAAKRIIDQVKEKIPKEDELFYQFQALQGDLYYKEKKMEEAACFYESAIPQKNQNLAFWVSPLLYRLAFCYLELTKQGLLEKKLFARAEKIFANLTEDNPEDYLYLAYAELLLNAGSQLEDLEALEKAEDILENRSLFKTQEGFFKAQLLLAQSRKSYEEREKLYQKISQDFNCLNTTWFFWGLNNFNQGLNLEREFGNEISKPYFKLAIGYFSKACDLFQKNAQMDKFFSAKKYLSLAQYKEGSCIENAIDNLDEILASKNMSAFMEPLEIYFHKATIFENSSKESGQIKALEVLNEGLLKFSSGDLAPRISYHLGRLYFQNQEFAKAETLFYKLSQEVPSFAPTALYWAYRSAQAAKKSEEVIADYKQKLFENYPKSSYADEAYFTLYSWQDYLQGERKAIKHLQNFSSKFPDSLYLMNAYYLLGMDFKRDRKSFEGKWINRKNFLAAIQAFNEAENCFEAFYKKGLIPEDRTSYYAILYYRSSLEKGLTNYEVAQESEGAKKQIYLEYASEIFKKIHSDFQKLDHSYTSLVQSHELFPKIEEESAYWLVKVYRLSNEDTQAEKLFMDLMEKYRSAKITKGYFLSKLYLDRGLWFFKKENYQSALEDFVKAEEAGKGKILGIEETLDLYIQQSLCYQELGELDQAMLILSKVINCDAASSLRLKAMFLRADVYQRQNRLVLAKRQLETIAKKGGEWAKKAQEKLNLEFRFE